MNKPKSILEKAETIAKAYLDDPTVTKEEHKKRIDLCMSCPHMSINANKNEQSTLVKTMMVLNPNKPFCTICKCFIIPKTSQHDEWCPLEESERKWDVVPKVVKKVKGTSTQYGVRALLKDEKDSPYELISEGNNTYSLHIGELSNTEPINIQVILQGSTKKLLGRPTVGASCGCTIPTLIQPEPRIAKYYLNIKFFPTKLKYKGVFNKNVKVLYSLNRRQQTLNINLKGELK